MIVSNNATTPDRVSVEMGFLPARATGVVVDTLSGPLRILGAYVPNKDNRSQSSVERKKRWIQEFSATLKATSSDTPVILMGDLNVVERGHVLKYPKEFLEFDYQFYDDLAVQHDLEDFFRRLHPDRTEYTATSDMPIRDFESTTAMVRLRSPQRCRAASTYMQRASAVLT
jgi:exodeoxyribonuclease-3